jgi:hypothetical protein
VHAGKLSNVFSDGNWVGRFPVAKTVDNCWSGWFAIGMDWSGKVRQACSQTEPTSVGVERFVKLALARANFYLEWEGSSSLLANRANFYLEWEGSLGCASGKVPSLLTNHPTAVGVGGLTVGGC